MHRSRPFFGGLFFLCSFLHCSKKPEEKAQPLVELFSYVVPGMEAPRRVSEDIVEAMDADPFRVNIHALGLLPLLHFRPHVLFSMSMQLDKKLREKFRFLNFGYDGFLLAQLGVQDSLESLAIYSRYNLEPAPEFVTPLSETAIAAELSKQFTPVILGFANSGNIDARMSCVPKGAHAIQESYLSRLGGDGGCVFFRTPLDTRFPHENFSTKLSCFNTKKNKFWEFPFDKAQFFFPLSDSEVVVYEGGYAPPRVTRISLDSGSTVEDERLQGNSILQEKSKVHAIPETPLGLYECSQSTLRATSQDVMEIAEKSWYYIDADVFLGVREPRPMSDDVWQIAFDADKRMNVQRLSWAQAGSHFPGFNSFPSPICARNLAVDVKCGISVLQMAVNFALENVSSGGGNAQVRAKKSLLAFALLHEFSQKIGPWLLEEEVWRLLTLFANDLKTATDRGDISGDIASEAGRFLMEERPEFEVKNASSHNALRAYVVAPEAFWNALMSRQ